MSTQKVFPLIKENDVKFVDLRFTDTKGKEQHVTIPVSQIDADFFEDGKMFDGSSIAGWKGINESDMVLMPDASSAVIDPFFEDVTLNIRCDVLEPATLQGYDRDPRSIAKRAEEFLNHQALLILLFLDQNQNSSYLMMCVLERRCQVVLFILMILKLLGTQVLNTKKVTKVTVQVLKVVTSRFLLLILHKIFVLKCV